MGAWRGPSATWHRTALPHAWPGRSGTNIKPELLRPPQRRAAGGSPPRPLTCKAEVPGAGLDPPVGLSASSFPFSCLHKALP